uniref:7TMR-DISMED2 domain-containing protein n=1 Tax=Arcobacter sp. LA11 TaxID=1898176 RepID=UPI0015772401
MSLIKIILLLIISSVIYAKPIVINDKTNFIDLLPYSQIYIDKTRKLSINDIQKKEITFKKNSQSLLGFGYSPKFDVWIKFTLQNDSDKIIYKIIEYDNTLTSKVVFFDPNNKYLEKR